MSLLVTCFIMIDAHEKQEQIGLQYDTNTGMTAGGNGNNRWDWEGNGNKTSLNVGVGTGMEMNSWERERMGLKKTFPLISNTL